MIGGALTSDNDGVWSRFVQLAGGPGARYVVFATASDNPERSAAHILANLRRRGAVAGSSAGAAIMSATVIRDAEDVMSVLNGTIRDGHEIGRGLGFVGPTVITDQHFLRRGRIGRLLPVMAATGCTRGLGVEENTAAVLHGEDVGIVGAAGALFVDLATRRATRRRVRPTCAACASAAST